MHCYRRYSVALIFRTCIEPVNRTHSFLREPFFFSARSRLAAKIVAICPLLLGLRNLPLIFIYSPPFTFLLPFSWDKNVSGIHIRIHTHAHAHALSPKAVKCKTIIMRRCDNRVLILVSLVRSKVMCFADSKLTINASTRRKRWSLIM